MKYSIKDSSVNVTKSAGNCEFGHICRRDLEWQTSFYVQCQTGQSFDRFFWGQKIISEYLESKF